MTKEESKEREDQVLDPGEGEKVDTEELVEMEGGVEVEPEEEPGVATGAQEEGLAEVDDEEGEGEEATDAQEGDELSELDAVKEELGRLRDQHLRLAADFENYRKRANADLAGNWVRARADLVRSLVEGLDDLQRVSQFTCEDTTVDALIEGVDLVERNILKALTEAGLEVLDPEGERFDPNTMEAMMRVPTEEDGQDETVQQVFLKGYKFKDQLVRPAKVSVYKDDD